MHGVSLSVKDGEGHGERAFPSKEPRVTFRMDPNAAELEVRFKAICASPCWGTSGVGIMCPVSFAGRFMRVQIPKRWANELQ